VSTAAIAVLLALLAASESATGIAMYRQRKFGAAEKEFRRVLSGNPKDAVARIHLARTLIELRRLPEALAEIERVLSQNADPEVRFQIGRIVRELAEQRFAELERAAPGSAAVRELAGRRFEMEGQLAEALEEYQAAAAVEPKRPGVRYMAGNILWKMRRLGEAAEELRAELAANPHHAMANLRLGEVLLARNEEALAAPHLERAVNAMPESVEARRELGKAYRKAGRLAEARREWETVAKVRPNDDQVHYLLGNLYRELGHKELARRELEKHRQILERRRALAEKR
jgi:tetratricopeptide (TPR) repeat protein